MSEALRELYPVNEMIKRGWIAGSDDPEELEQQLRTFFALEPGHLTPELPPGILCGGFGAASTQELGPLIDPPGASDA